MIYEGFESILAPQDNGKQNSGKSYKNKYQKHIACSYGYKLDGADDKFSNPFKTYLGKDTVYNFIGSMIEENKYFSEMMEKNFNKELVMTIGDNEDFKNSTKCWICDNYYVDNVKVRDNRNITGKYRCSAHRDCNINLKVLEYPFKQICMLKNMTALLYTYFL